MSGWITGWLPASGGCQRYNTLRMAEIGTEKQDKCPWSGPFHALPPETVAYCHQGSLLPLRPTSRWSSSADRLITTSCRITFTNFSVSPWNATLVQRLQNLGYKVTLEAHSPAV